MKKVKFILPLIFLLVGVSLAPVKANAGGRIYFDPAEGNYNVGDEFTVVVKADPGNQGIVAIDALINFDADKLEVSGVEERIYFKDESTGTNQSFTYNIENSSGRLAIYSFATIGNFSVDKAGAFAAIRFKAKAAGTANVNLVCKQNASDDSSLWSAESEDLIDCAAVGSGVYTITEESGGGEEEEETTTPTSTPTPTSAATAGGATSTPTPTALPETGILEPLYLGVVLGGIFLGVGFLGLLF